MKKTLLILLLLVPALECVSQDNMGNYYSSYSRKSYPVSASVDSVNRLSLYIYIDGQSNSNETAISIKGEGIDDFVTSLKKIRKQYAEWELVAKDYSIRNSSRLFDIQMPPVTICWYTDKWHFAFNSTLVPRFVVSENGSCVLSMKGQVQSTLDKNISSEYTFALEGTDEIDRFLECIDPVRIRKALDSK